MRSLVPLLFLISLEGHAQVWHMKRSIAWDHPCQAKEIQIDSFISFSGATYDNVLAFFPVYFELFEWHPENTDVDAMLVNVTYEEFEGKLTASRITEMAGRDEIKASVAFASLKPYLQVTIFPFRINDISGKLERIKDFIIRIESNPDQEPFFSQICRSSKKLSLNGNSVLSSGKWFKIRVAETGMYKLSFEQLRSMGFDDPSRVRIYGNGGNLMPEDYRKGNKDDLLPTQLHFVKGDDNIFNQGDYILFYALGPVSWNYDEVRGIFRQKKNYYSDYGYYFITSGTGGPDIPVSGDVIPPEPSGYTTSSFDSYTFHETENKSFKETINGMRTGKEWYGENFTNVIEQTFAFTLPGLIKSLPVQIFTEVLARSKDSSSFYLSYKNLNIDTLAIRSTDVTDYTATAAFPGTGKTSLQVSEDAFSLTLRFNKKEGNALGWLDFITINGRSELRLIGDYLIFRDKSSVAEGMVTSFQISSADNKVQVWDVTDPNNILKFSSEINGSLLTFSARTDSLREFVTFRENGAFPSPQITGEGLGFIDNQDIHGLADPDMIILSHADFLPAANRLADYRRSEADLNVAVVTPEQVYNEFSSGTPDISAIRNFIKYLYDKASGDPLKIPGYLLLMGDGSYDNKGIDPNATNFILTYQSDNSTSPVSSYVSDDFFALLDAGESMLDGLLDIGVGRLPVKTAQEADELVTKIIDYEKPDRMGDWRNRICFIADDEDDNIHLAQADQLADYVQYNYPDLNIGKIYLDAYQQISAPSGQKYPDVNVAINDQINRGAIIINYTGHGGVKGLAHEQVLTLPEIVKWKNKQHLPLFMTATCEFSRYDEHEITTAGEAVLLNKEGGGIALFATTRLVYSGPNHALNEKFYQIVFAKNGQNQHFRLGDIMKFSKNNTGSGINKRNFTLLGDPSLMLAYPALKVIADSVNGVDISFSGDTIRALQKVTISGHIAHDDGTLLNSFNGTVFPTVFDKMSSQYTLGNDGGNVKSFTIRNNVIYKGKVSARSGRFNFSFIVPKDINYAYNAGKLSFYATDSIIDASGSNQDLVIGGSDPDAGIDNIGPCVEVFMNDTFFMSGGITDENPVLYVRIYDENGINTTGNGIGHDITGYLDGNTKKTQSLNEFYQSDTDSYQSGEIRYPLSDLDEGRHTVLVKVWDIYNNSGDGYTEFIVFRDADLILDGIINFPNPFTEETWFSFEHNRKGTPLDITIEIFNLGGELIRKLRARDEGTGFRTHPIYWDGRDESGGFIGQGLYIYRIRVAGSDGFSAEKSGKLIILK